MLYSSVRLRAIQHEGDGGGDGLDEGCRDLVAEAAGGRRQGAAADDDGRYAVMGDGAVAGGAEFVVQTIGVLHGGQAGGRVADAGTLGGVGGGGDAGAEGGVETRCGGDDREAVAGGGGEGGFGRPVTGTERCARAAARPGSPKAAMRMPARAVASRVDAMRAISAAAAARAGSSVMIGAPKVAVVPWIVAAPARDSVTMASIMRVVAVLVFGLMSRNSVGGLRVGSG